MKRYIVNINVYGKPQFSGVFNFITLREACSKIRASLHCLCSEDDAKKGLSSGAVHFWDEDNGGQADISIQQG